MTTMADYFLKGFVGAIPELSQVNGNNLATFIISINVGTANKPDRQWIKCSAWRELADLVKEYVFQGDLLGINGRILDIKAFMNKQGKPQATVDIRADEIFKSFRPGEFKNIKTLERKDRP